MHPLYDFEAEEWWFGPRRSTEREQIEARIRSRRRWHRRRMWLRIRALLGGRRKLILRTAPRTSGARWLSGQVGPAPDRVSSNLIDSPQPQASVTFGLRNLNPASSSETS